MPTNFNLSLPDTYSRVRNDGVPLSSGTIADAIRSVQTSSGVVRRKPKGWIPPTNYILAFTQYQRATGRAAAQHKSGNPTLGSVSTGCVGGLTAFNSLLSFDQTLVESFIGDESLRNQALIACRNKVKNTDINLGVAFAERKATARLLGDTAFNIGKSFMDLRRGRIRSAMNRLGISSKAREPRGGNVPRKWLELQYGWKPLLSDVYGACEALSKRDRADWRVTAKATARSSSTRVVNFGGGNWGFCRVKVENLAFVRIDALPSNENLISLASLGVTNPLLIGWELVPFSFVVDWAFPVGNWLESLDALLGYGLSYTSNTLFSKAYWEHIGTSGQDGSYIYDNSYAGFKRAVRLNRVASNNVPLPRFPRIKDPASLGHMANGLALLASSFRR